jgi:aminoglycoside phosphotransferase (APT) family kinase protein
MREEAKARATPPDVENIRSRAEAAINQRFPCARLASLAQFASGSSSLTYWAEVTNAAVERVVIKAAPAGLPPVRNRDVLRQARVLTAVAAVPEVRVPEIYALDPGAPVEVPPLFVMAHIDGTSYEPRSTPPENAPPDTAVRARARTAVRMLAAMHAARLEDLSGISEEPVVSLVNEVEKWRKAAASRDLAPGIRQLEGAAYQRLSRRIPDQQGPSVLHGDWRLGNMLCRDAEVLGVIDWEIWSVGDPRVDLAWMQLMADPKRPRVPYPAAVTLEPNELAAEYAAAAGHDVPDLAWFGALVRYKQAAATMLLVKNAARRGDTDERWRLIDEAVGGLFEAAIEYAGRSSW